MTFLGKLDRYLDFASQCIAAQNVDVWLPSEYDSEPERRFPVL